MDELFHAGTVEGDGQGWLQCRPVPTWQGSHLEVWSQVRLSPFHLVAWPGACCQCVLLLSRAAGEDSPLVFRPKLSKRRYIFFFLHQKGFESYG